MNNQQPAHPFLFFTPTTTPEPVPEYNEEERSTAYRTIRLMESGPEKILALQEFIAMEESLLHPVTRGGRIDAARELLNYLLNPKQNITVPAFPELDTGTSSLKNNMR